MTLLHHTALNPWRHFDRLFEARSGRPSWAPAFDISENDDAYVLRGDLPGVAQDDIEIRLEDNVLTLRAERKATETDGMRQYSLVERPSGKFCRRFVLPQDVDYDDIKANFENGVIELVVAKQAPVDNSRLIPVH